MDREQLERDLEQFAALAPTLGSDAEVEIFDPLLQAAIRVSMEEPGSWWRPTAPIGVPWIGLLRKRRRARIRRAARARKARRGWR